MGIRDEKDLEFTKIDFTNVYRAMCSLRNVVFANCEQVKSIGSAARVEQTLGGRDSYVHII